MFLTFQASEADPKISPTQRQTRLPQRLSTHLSSIFGSHPVLLTGTIFLALFAMFLAGAAFFPLASSADEAAHYVYSAAVVRGQAGMLEPMLPARIANIHDFATCIGFHPEVTAACQASETVEGVGDVLSQTNAGLYNPVFYAWTGLGSLVVPTEYGLYFSRALAALVSAAFLAWGISLAWRRARSTWPMIGVALILTPMTVYVGSVLNPSAWEISTLFAVTVAGYHLWRTPSKGWTESHTLLLLAGSLLIVTRGLSPLFLALAVATIALTFPWRSTRTLLARRATWAVATIWALIAAATIFWVLVHGTNYVGVERPASLADGLRSIPVFYASFNEQIIQMYGNLGWLDLPSPQVLSSAWLFLMGGVVLTTSAIAPARGRRGVIFAFAVATLLPGTLAGLQWSGLGWQGRYTLPLVGLLLVVCTLTVDGLRPAMGADATVVRRLETFFRAIVPSFFVVGLIVIMFRVAHRYTVGEPAPWFAAASWLPPLSLLLLAATFLAGLTIVTIVLITRPPLRVGPSAT
ncbi:DUF2142 domain-containing protein [Microbacterium sp. P04]|uniref:DUF2142 domain-containing protein n=1 Tax=Microbacterium sp. P04 TaxID=3366947 RepID=UPI00374670D5